jgi:hypothetical protein
MFRTLILSAWTLLHLYVLWRASSAPPVGRLVPRRLLAAVGAAVWASYLVLRLADLPREAPPWSWMDLAALHWLVVLFLTAIPLLAVDLLTLGGFLLRRRLPLLRGLALLAGLLLSLTALLQGLRPPAVVSHQVELAGLPAGLDGTVLVALSDLHLGPERGERWLRARVAQVQAQGPDLVVLLGDTFEGHGEADGEPAAAFRLLRPRLGTWAVTGNHEFHGGESTRLLEEAGIRILRDTWVPLARGLVLAGVDDLTRRRGGRDGAAVERALTGRPPGATILLSHAPLQAERAAAAGAGLMLSGHTHGGQIWPFGYLVGLSYPLVAGRATVAGMPAIVSRGTGSWGPRMRLWRRGEILRITLRSPAAPGATPAAPPP